MQFNEAYDNLTELIEQYQFYQEVNDDSEDWDFDEEEDDEEVDSANSSN